MNGVVDKHPIFGTTCIRVIKTECIDGYEHVLQVYFYWVKILSQILVEIVRWFELTRCRGRSL